MGVPAARLHLGRYPTKEVGSPFSKSKGRDHPVAADQLRCKKRQAPGSNSCHSAFPQAPLYHRSCCAEIGRVGPISHRFCSCELVAAAIVMIRRVDPGQPSRCAALCGLGPMTLLRARF